MITDKRLQELIDMYEWYVSNVDVRTAEFKEFEATLSTLKELQQLRKKEDGYALLLKSTNYDLKRQTEYSDKLRKQNKLLIEDGDNLAELVRPMSHNYCEDSWYSCPKAEDGCADDREGDECNCGADRWNKQIEPVLDQHKELKAQIETKV